MHKCITLPPLSCFTRSYPIPNPWLSRDFATPTQLGLPPQPQPNAGLCSEVRLVEIKLLCRVEQCSIGSLSSALDITSCQLLPDWLTSNIHSVIMLIQPHLLLSARPVH